jgi:RloB-like protein
VRQAAQLQRKKANRASHDRILIVSEGSKTEPLYFDEIRQYFRLHTANVQVRPSGFGTQPLQVVEYAEQLFLKGDSTKGIASRAFEQVYAVFDRDDHATYHAALSKAAALNKKLKSELGTAVRFEAIASVPCFELWLLLHFEDLLAPLHRAEVAQRLSQHLVTYAKGQAVLFAATRQHLARAIERTTQLAAQYSAYDGQQPFTDIYRLVDVLTSLKVR